MKVGTLTFHAPNNNGSFLQAYALQNILNDLGILGNKVCDVDKFIRYMPAYSCVDNKMELLRSN